jgi:transcriptional regulator with XRE-family HTH domain
VSFLSRAGLVTKLLTNREFRDSYVYEHVRNGIPFQIRAIRKKRNWSQAQLANAAETSRTVITRIEDPNYGNLTLKTLYQIASAFDVALLVTFVPFSRLLREYEDVSPDALTAKDILNERELLQRWANAKQVESTSGVMPLNQGQFAFAQTSPTEASAMQETATRPEVCGEASSSIISIKTRRPLRQRQKPQKRIHARLRQTA